ncbi:Flp pilus assembly protein CpaB [Sphingomonas solaris]|uniref:Flp pilus assembly protein CpaB n=1 Tax=Alterirhizorhabdus solaris TaxID=2529389 RepID=A0A558QZ34_9SPHN|nr:Flp pilus assembly protein CpaB [Sphingomonas solaris]TVV72369.1 Flp pilus assembly protein CpaB [Sphingomonas solaris]
MDGKRLALLVGALLLAGVSAFLARSMLSGSGAPTADAAQVPIGSEVLVAIRALPVGTIIGPESLRYQPWPKDMVENVYYQRGSVDPATLNGAVVRSEVTAGQPLTIGSLVKPGDRGFLAAALGPGMRAVTVPVSAQSGVGGFVFPGDRIDLVLTQSVSGGGDGAPLKTSETIIRNMRVLATDQRTDNVAGEDGKTVVAAFSTVTLEATPKIAEKIAVAQTIGTLSLSLRSIADDTAELERAIAAGEVTVPQNGDPKLEKQMLLQVASRPIDSDTTFTVGADVSRFQRRTVPAKPSNGGFGPPLAGPLPPAPSNSLEGSVRPVGPVVRVARGNNVTEVPVGGK